MQKCRFSESAPFHRRGSSLIISYNWHRLVAGVARYQRGRRRPRKTATLSQWPTWDALVADRPAASLQSSTGSTPPRALTHEEPPRRWVPTSYTTCQLASNRSNLLFDFAKMKYSVFVCLCLLHSVLAVEIQFGGRDRRGKSRPGPSGSLFTGICNNCTYAAIWGIAIAEPDRYRHSNN